MQRPKRWPAPATCATLGALLAHRGRRRAAHETLRTAGYRRHSRRGRLVSVRIWRRFRHQDPGWQRQPADEHSHARLGRRAGGNPLQTDRQPSAGSSTDRRAGDGLYPRLGPAPAGRGRRGTGRRAGARGHRMEPRRARREVRPSAARCPHPGTEPGCCRAAPGSARGLRCDHAGCRQRPRGPDAEAQQLALFAGWPRCLRPRLAAGRRTGGVVGQH